jgi:hypothetical protein
LNRERFIIDDPKVPVTLPVATWRAILAACEWRRVHWQAERRQPILPDGSLAQAIGFLRAKTATGENTDFLTLRERMASFSFLVNICLAEGEMAGVKLVEALSAIQFRAKPTEPDPEKEAELKQQVKVAQAILAEYGDDPVPLPEKPGAEKPSPKPKKPTNDGQRSLFADEGSPASVA